LVFDGGLFFEGLLGIRVFFLFGVFGEGIAFDLLGRFGESIAFDLLGLFGEGIAFDLLGLFGVRDFTSGFTGNVDFLWNIHK